MKKKILALCAAVALIIGTVATPAMAADSLKFEEAFEDASYTIQSSGRIEDADGNKIAGSWGVTPVIDADALKLTSTDTWWGVHFDLAELKNTDLTGKYFYVTFGIRTDSATKTAVTVSLDYDNSGKVALGTTDAQKRDGDVYGGFFARRIQIPTTGSSKMELSIQAEGTSATGTNYWIDSVTVAEIGEDDAFNMTFDAGWGDRPQADNRTKVSGVDNPFNASHGKAIYVHGGQTSLYWHLNDVAANCEVGDKFVITFDVAPHPDNTAAVVSDWYFNGGFSSTGDNEKIVSDFKVEAGSGYQKRSIVLTVKSKSTTLPEIYQSLKTNSENGFYIDNFRMTKIVEKDYTFYGFEDSEGMYVSKINDSRHDFYNMAGTNTVMYNLSSAEITGDAAATGSKSLKIVPNDVYASVYMRAGEVKTTNLAGKKLQITMKVKSTVSSPITVNVTTTPSTGNSFTITPGVGEFKTTVASVILPATSSETYFKELEMLNFTNGATYYIDDIIFEFVDPNMIFEWNYDDKDQTLVSDPKDGTIAKVADPANAENTCIRYSTSDGYYKSVYIKQNSDGTGKFTLTPNQTYEFGIKYKGDASNPGTLDMELCRAFYSNTLGAVDQAHLTTADNSECVITVTNKDTEWKEVTVRFKIDYTKTMDDVDIYVIGVSNNKGDTNVADGNLLYIDDVYLKKVDVTKDVTGIFEFGEIEADDMTTLTAGTTYNYNIKNAATVTGTAKDLLTAVAIYDGDKLVAIDGKITNLPDDSVVNDINHAVTVPNVAATTGYTYKILTLDYAGLAPIVMAQ